MRDEHDQQAMQAGKKLREGVLKQRAASGGRTRFEVRLESKKHRRTSRRSVRAPFERLATPAVVHLCMQQPQEVA